jgi:hypothetical protein
MAAADTRIIKILDRIIIHSLSNRKLEILKETFTNSETITLEQDVKVNARIDEFIIDDIQIHKIKLVLKS